ncbi:OmpA family protein [Aureispira sp. CCB-E]|uniref:OmpA family protein n=1 Tax=Aureispira sp. CCB-E TaxID=3051121 RepID=UPI002868E1AA|nr:OmpA family protein [Aureispira sp. CCB-E]WMX13839.1 OmpA family protein [Aureispira sp. CCB-E]
MATSIDKIQELEDELQYMDDKLCYYGELFNADGYISDEEDKKLKKMQASIEKAKAKLAKLKQIKRSNNRKLNAAKALIAELENVFVESNLELTPYTKLQDYSMDIATISGRIKASGVLERKAQKIIDRLDDWDKKIHQAIDKKVALIQQKKEKSKTKKKEKQKKVKEEPYSETPIQSTLGSFSIIAEANVLVTCSNGKKITRSISDAYKDDSITLPQNTTGSITIELKFILSHGDTIINTFTRYETISTHYEVQGNGTISINALKTYSQFNRENIFASIIKQILVLGKLHPDDKKFTNELKKLITKINQQTITIDTSAELNNNTIVLKAQASVDSNNLDMGASIGIASIDYSAILFKGFELNMQIPIIFKAQKPKKETDNSSIKFEKNEVTLDKGDKNQLHRLIVEDFSKLVATKLKKDFPHKTFSTQEISMIRDLTLKQKNDEYYSIYLEGTTSCEGSEEINRKISKGRQNSVKEYLIELGVEPSNFVLSPPIGELKCRKYMGSDEKEKDNPKEVSIVLSLKKLKMLSE